MKTKSLWGNPPSRYYAFLRRVELGFGLKKLALSVLGCSDGKFVLPAARKGYYVLALDIDEKAIFGGEKIGPNGPIYMEGLFSRVKKERLEQRVKIVCEDFVKYKTSEKFHAVWTSGAINYSYNLKNNVSDILERVKSYVLPNGYIYFDYMLPLETPHFSRENYFPKGELVKHFKKDKWDIIYDRILPPMLEKAHVDMPVDHYHHWGHLCIRAKR
jgi:hypothetical protein